jgi:hypothetical protein
MANNAAVARKMQDASGFIGMRRWFQQRALIRREELKKEKE